MTCRECLERLSPHYDGALPAEEEAEVVAHLASCGACRWEWEAFRRALEAISGLATPSEPEGLAARVEGAWRGASAEGARRWVVAVVIYIAAVVGTVLALRSC